MAREEKPDHFRLCACGALVSVWCGPRHVSVSHRRPLCAAYADIAPESDGAVAAYLTDHTTASSGPDEG